jgi:predicted amidohydrolase YtcJ
MKTQYTHGRFYTLDDSLPIVEEVWVENGLIIHLGKHPFWRPDKTIDVQGWMGLPGFVDAHLHILGYGEKLTLLNLEKDTNRERIINKIKDRFQGKFLYVQGHVEQALTKVDLDFISSTIPILLRHADYHGATVNSALLKMIGFNNHPNGILHEADAMKAVQSIPKYTKIELQSMIKTALKQLHQFGITGGHSDDLYYFNGFHETLSAFEEVLQSMPFRTHLLMHHLTLDDFIKSGRPWLNQHPYLQLGAIKTFYDGTISSRTALMEYPYQGFTHPGERQFSNPSWETLIKKVRKLGLPLAIHTIGDLALEEVAYWLDKFPVKDGLHDRIIHASFANKKTIQLLKKLSVIFDIQPQFLSSDLPWALSYISPRTENIYPWKSYHDAGLILCGGSDAPVEIPNPLLGIAAAYQRRSSHDGKVYHPEQRLSLIDAIKLYTIGANIPTYDSARRGKLKIGYLADFTFLKDDVMVNETMLSKTKVMMTVIDNQIVYRRD